MLIKCSLKANSIVIEKKGNKRSVLFGREKLKLAALCLDKRREKLLSDRIKEKKKSPTALIWEEREI